MKEALGNLPTTVGKGEHQQPIMEAIVMGMRDLALKVSDLEGAVYMSWEGPISWDYVNYGVEYRKHYSDACRQVKGTSN